MASGLSRDSLLLDLPDKSQPPDTAEPSPWALRERKSEGHTASVFGLVLHAVTIA